jgi:cell division protein FtsI/penicillin-binding protein 2
VVASVQAGRTVVPRLLTDRRPDDVAPDQPLTSREAATLRTMLRGVVTGGSAAFLADLPRDPVIAKTGTAEFGTDDPPETHAWMVAAQGDLAAAVFVDVGESGSRTAGPLLESFLRGL